MTTWIFEQHNKTLKWPNWSDLKPAELRFDKTYMSQLPVNITLIYVGPALPLGRAFAYAVQFIFLKVATWCVIPETEKQDGS